MVSAVKFPPVVYTVKCSKLSLKFEDKFSFQISNFFNPSLTWRHDINFGQLMSIVFITYWHGLEQNPFLLDFKPYDMLKCKWLIACFISEFGHISQYLLQASLYGKLSTFKSFIILANWSFLSYNHQAKNFFRNNLIFFNIQHRCNKFPWNALTHSFLCNLDSVWFCTCWSCDHKDSQFRHDSLTKYIFKFSISLKHKILFLPSVYTHKSRANLQPFFISQATKFVHSVENWHKSERKGQ